MADATLLQRVMQMLGAQASAKQQFGQQGAAGQMNGDITDAYKQYAEGEMVAGRQPLPLPQWYQQMQQQQQPPRQPLSSLAPPQQ